jgi:hypothetical protein
MSSEERRVNESSFATAVDNSFKAPHVQLTDKRSVLYLAEEKWKDFDKFVRIVNLETTPVVNPRQNVLKPLLFDVGHHIMKFPRELYIWATSTPFATRSTVCFLRGLTHHLSKQVEGVSFSNQIVRLW